MAQLDAGGYLCKTTTENTLETYLFVTIGYYTLCKQVSFKNIDSKTI